MSHRYDILQKYMIEHDKLKFCVDLLEHGVKHPEKRQFYETYADNINKTLINMEERHPFLVNILQIIDAGDV